MSQRVRVLDEVLSDIQLLRADISYCAAPLPDILKRTKSKLFDYVSVHLETGFRDAWNTAISKCTVLKPEDRIALMSLSGIGTSDTTGQLLVLDNAAYRIADARGRAEKELVEKGRMITSCALLAGVAAAIMII